MALDSIISGYIASDNAKRIIIPGIGAFIKRGRGELVFMEMLSTDDGILTGEVAGRLSLPADEAAAEVSKYAAAIKVKLNKGLVVNIAGLGTISPDGDRLVFTPADTVKVLQDNKQEVKIPEETEATQHKEILQHKAEAVKHNEDVKRREDDESEPQEVVAAAATKLHIRQQTKKRKRPDVVMIIAILAVAAAVAVLIYGGSVNS